MIITHNEIEKFNKLISESLTNNIILGSFFNSSSIDSTNILYDEDDRNIYIASLMIDNMLKLGFIGEKNEKIEIFFPSFNTKINLFLHLTKLQYQIAKD